MDDSYCSGDRPPAARPCIFTDSTVYDFDVNSPCGAVASNDTQVLFYADTEPNGGWTCAHGASPPYGPPSGHTASDVGGAYYLLEVPSAPSPVTHWLDGPLLNASVDIPDHNCNLTFWLFGNAPASNYENLNNLIVEAVVCNESSAVTLAVVNSTDASFPSSGWQLISVIVPSPLSGLYRFRWRAELALPSSTGGSWALDDVQFGPGCVPAYTVAPVDQPSKSRVWPAGVILGVLCGAVFGAFLVGIGLYGVGTCPSLGVRS